MRFIVNKIKSFVQDLNLSPNMLGKTVLFVGALFLVILFVVTAIVATVKILSYGFGHEDFEARSISPQYAYDKVIREVAEEIDGLFEGSAVGFDISASKVSARGMPSVMPVPPYIPEMGVSEDMEEYERVSYNAFFEKYNINPYCDKIEGLKRASYIVFKSSNRMDKQCSYRFSVESEKEEAVAEIVREMTPKSFDINIETREPAVSANMFEVDLLQNRLDSIDASIKQAEKAYNEAINLATRKGDVAGMSSLINGKLNLLERLENQKRSISQQIERAKRSGDRSLSETQYAHFYVNINKKEFIDFSQIIDEWRYAFEKFVMSVNKLLQGLTFGLIVFAIVIFKMLAYLFIVIVFVRVAWILAKKIWKFNFNPAQALRKREE